MLIWADEKPRMRGDGGMFHLGDEVPTGHFSEVELASLIERGKVKVDEPKVVDLKPVVDEPAVDEPVVDEPVVDEPVVDDKPKPKRKSRSKTKGW